MEKLGAYEMVRRVPLSPQHVASRSPSPLYPVGTWGGRAWSGDRAVLTAREEEEAGSQILPLLQLSGMLWGRGPTLPTGTLLFKAVFLSSHLFCLPPALRTGKAAWLAVRRWPLGGRTG